MKCWRRSGRPAGACWVISLLCWMSGRRWSGLRAASRLTRSPRSIPFEPFGVRGEEAIDLVTLGDALGDPGVQCFLLGGGTDDDVEQVEGNDHDAVVVSDEDVARLDG